MPAWSMGTAPKGKQVKTTPMTNPGPGQYEQLIRARSSSGWSVGKAQRNSFSKMLSSPGPGAYQIKDTIGGPKYHFAGKSQINLSQLTPGPGQYTPDIRTIQAKSTYLFSMRGRPQSANIKANGPAPGSYTIEVRKDRSLGAFSKSQRRSLGDYAKSGEPGPGAYGSNSNWNSAKSPSYTFGSKGAGSAIGEVKATPGPGAYGCKGFIGSEGVKPTFSGKRPDSAPSYGRNVPGPNAYFASGDFGFRTIRACKIGTEQRGKSLLQSIKNPGPGAYNLDEKLAGKRSSTPAWSMGKAHRVGLGNSELKNIPGPGQYGFKETIGAGPKYAMRPKTAIILKQGGPGPGQYNPLTNNQRPPSAVMGKGSRGNAMGGKEGLPGPGSYMYYSQIKAFPAYSFGVSRKQQASESSPGPGHYKVPYSVARVPDYLIPGRSKEFDFV